MHWSSQTINFHNKRVCAFHWTELLFSVFTKELITLVDLNFGFLYALCFNVVCTFRWHEFLHINYIIIKLSRTLTCYCCIVFHAYTCTCIIFQVFKTLFGDMLNQYGLLVAPVLLHPKSRGTIRLQSMNPQTPPAIDPAYLSHPDDVKILLEGRFKSDC